jgi:hypothetical protein
MATGVHTTHDGWLTLYLRETPCTDYNRFRLVVHNLSPVAIGSRAYALTTCNGTVNNLWLWGAYIPAGGALVSPEEPGMDKYGNAATVAGIIYYPYSGSGLREPDTYTGCVR